MSQEKASNDILADLEKVSTTAYGDEIRKKFKDLQDIAKKINSYIVQSEQLKIQDQDSYEIVVARRQGLIAIKDYLQKMDELYPHVVRLQDAISTLSRSIESSVVYAELKDSVSEISLDPNTTVKVDRYSQESTSFVRQKMEEKTEEQEKEINQKLEELRDKKKEKEVLLKKKQEEYNKLSKNLVDLRTNPQNDARKKTIEDKQEERQALADISARAFTTQPQASDILLHIVNRFQSIDKFFNYLGINPDVQERLKKAKRHSRHSKESLPATEELLIEPEKSSVEQKSKKEIKAEEKKLKEEKKAKKKEEKETKKKLKEVAKDLEKQLKEETKRHSGKEVSVKDAKKTEEKKSKEKEKTRKKEEKESKKAEKQHLKELKEKEKQEQIIQKQQEKARDKEFLRPFEARLKQQAAYEKEFKQGKRVLKRLLRDKKKKYIDNQSLRDFFKHKVNAKNQALTAEIGQIAFIQQEHEKEEHRLSSQCDSVSKEIATIEKEIHSINENIQKYSSPSAHSSQLALEDYNQLIAGMNLRLYSEQVRTLELAINTQPQDLNEALRYIDAKMKEVTKLEETIKNQKFGIPESETEKLLEDLKNIKHQLEKDRKITEENKRILKNQQTAIAERKVEFKAFWQNKLDTYLEERSKKYAMKDALTESDKKKRELFIGSIKHFLNLYDPEFADPTVADNYKYPDKGLTLKQFIDRGLKQFKTGVFSNTKDDYKNLHGLLLKLKESMQEIEANIGSSAQDSLLSTMQRQLNRENIPVTLEKDWKKELTDFWRGKFESYKTNRDRKYSMKDSLTQSFFGDRSDKRKRTQFQTELFEILELYNGTAGDLYTHRLHDKINEGLKLFKSGVFSDTKDEYNNLHDLLLKLQKSIEIVENVVQGPAYKKS